MATEDAATAGVLDLADTLRFTQELVAEAAERARSFVARGFGQALKLDGTVVTDVDKSIERFLRDAIAARFPGHAILGEEFGFDGPPDVPLWALDPIDGTTNLANGLPLWSISVGLVVGDTPVVGVIAAPLMGETYAGGRGLGAWLNGESLAPLPSGGALRWEDTYGVSSTCVRVLDFDEIPGRLRVHGSAAFDLCYVVSGRFRGCQSIATSLYDVAAGACLAGEVGAETMWLSGAPWSPRDMARTGPRDEVLLTAPPATLAFVRERLRG